jgi:hypothetical protein
VAPTSHPMAVQRRAEGHTESVRSLAGYPYRAKFDGFGEFVHEPNGTRLT